MNKLCDYGCGRKALYRYSNGKLCCEKHSNKCPEIRRKISEKHKGKTLSEETINKMKGRKVWNKGISPSEESKRKQSESMKKLHENINSIYHTKEYKDKKSKALKGRSPSKETREKIKKSLLKYMSIKENHDKTIKENNYKYKKTNEEVFGREKSLEISKKIRSKFKGKTYEEIMKYKNTALKRRKHLKECLLNKNHPIHNERSLEKRSGKNHHSWNPNRDEVYKVCTEKFFNKKFRSIIIHEQHNICLICNKYLGNYRLTLHHIDYNKGNDNRCNLMMVHNSCNAKVNFNIEYWKNMLLLKNVKLIGENYV